MKSQELGRIFENAASKILIELFKLWGYEIDAWKAQKSGTQHGFDIYFKLLKKYTRLNVFVECKASKKPNAIPASELTGKANHLDWAGFAEKDILIFFSPTRAIDFDNEYLSIEEDSRPFAIIDWMRKETETSPVLELFAAYAGYGSDPDVLKFRDFLLSGIVPGFHTTRAFAEISADLKRHFDRRIAEHIGKERNRDYCIINGAFWAQIQEETHTDYLYQYYTRANASTPRLREVVANDFHIKNEALNKQFDKTLDQAIKNRASLIKVLSKGGEGKSTFLYQIARTYCESNTVIWLESLQSEVLAEISERIRHLDTERPIIFLLDNAAVYGKPLTEFAEKLTTGFRRCNVALVIAEREFRYSNIEEIERFEAVFNECYEINYKSTRIRKQVFDRLIFYLNPENTIAEELKREAEAVFMEDRRKGLTECAFSVIKLLKAAKQLKGYRFDWEDWEAFAEKKAPKLRRLYLLLSTFYQFGFSLDFQFCASALKDVDYIEINSALSNNPNLPIYRRGHHLLLPHETIASWYLDDSNEGGRIHRANSEEIFKTFLSNINTSFERDLFIRLCIKNKDFRNSYLARYADDDKQISVLESFVARNRGELKCRTELSKIYQKRKRLDAAKAILFELLEIDSNNLHARTELSRIYQRQKRWKEAEEVLLECLEIAPDDLNSRTELSKIYQRQNRLHEAEKLLQECLDIKSDDINSLLELGKIYSRDFRRYTEAESCFQRLLQIEQGNLYAKTELALLYKKMRKYGLREKILFEIYDTNQENIPTLMDLAKVFRRFRKYRIAMRQCHASA